VRVVSVDPANPRASSLDAAVETLHAGGSVALPTETFYGLACDGLDGDALARINRLKGKPAGEPILLLLADIGQVEQIASELPPTFNALAERFWPGPLTLVVPARSGLPAEVGGAGGTVAVRVPGLALPRLLARRLGRPISGPSANRSGEPPCRSAAAVAEIFGDEVDLVLDGGPTAGGAPSTIVDLTGDLPRVLRDGLTPAAALGPFLP